MRKAGQLIPRIGGKTRLAPWIGEFIKRHEFSIYCEPFVGSAAVYFWLINEGIPQLIKTNGKPLRVVLNDADREIMNLYKMVRDYPELLAYSVYFTPYSRAEHKESQQRGTGNLLEDARKYLTDAGQGFASKPNSSWGISREKGIVPTFSTRPSRILAAAPHLGTPETLDPYDCLNGVGRQFVEPSIDFRVEWVRRYLVDSWQLASNRFGDEWRTKQETDQQKTDMNSRQSLGSVPSQVLNTLPHLQPTVDELKKVYLECDDAIKVIERWADTETLFYLDPPYINCEDYYACNAKKSKENNLKFHYDLANVINSVECAGAIVSYYPNDLLDELYPVENWDRHYKETVASSAGVTRTSRTKTKPKRTELLLIRKQNKPINVSLSGQMSLF